MRSPEEQVAVDGSRTWKVRYRSAGIETSETFPRLADAKTFAALLDAGGPAEGLAWIAAKRRDIDAATFGEWFETYLEQLTGITKRTRDDYRSLHRRYLTELDMLPLPLISRAHIAAIVNRLDAEGKSPKTIKNVMHMLSSVLALAVDDGHLTRNPVKRVRLPKQQMSEEEIVRFLTKREAAVLVDAMPEHYQPLVIFMLGTGLRWSEATALQARHVDLDAGTVRVVRAWKRVPGGWEVGPPKSTKSTRTVNAAVAALLAVEPLLKGAKDLVFTTPRGGVVRHSNFYNRIWVPACNSAGFVPRPTPHDCRHSFASWLISDGIDLSAVQDQLGHESYETTRKVYAHLLPAVGVAAGKAASAAMGEVLAHRAEIRAASEALALAPGSTP